MSVSDRLLIVNADDLGRTPGINRGTFEAHVNGLVSSATLMVGFPAAAEAAELMADYPDLGVGLHVTLTGGPPLLPPEYVPSLVDENGLLPDRPAGLTGAAPEEILVEVQAQLDRFQQLTGGLPTHLDSHHHSHRLPVVCEALATVAHHLSLPVRGASPEVAEWLQETDVASTDDFVEEFFGANARLDVFLRILRDLGPGVTEVMCHPAYVDEDLRYDSSYTDEREEELAVLTRPEVRRAMEEGEIHLTHFGLL